MQITNEQELMLAKLSQVQRTPQEYAAMLESLPDNVKRTFVELDAGAVREYSMRSVKKKLKDNPEMAKLLDSAAVRQIVDSVYKNVLDDQRKVKESMAKPAQDSGQKSRYQVVRR